MDRSSLIVAFLVLVMGCLFAWYPRPAAFAGVDGEVGVSYTHEPILAVPSPKTVAAAVKKMGFKSVRIDGANPTILAAFWDSGGSLLLSIPNSLLPALVDQAFADAWVSANVVPFQGFTTTVKAVSVGADVHLTDGARFLIPAIRNVQAALKKHGQIPVSTTISVTSVLTSIFPPSDSRFKDPYRIPIIKPLLSFLNETNSVFLVNLHPYHVYVQQELGISLSFALFQSASPFDYWVDYGSGIRYSNLFDVMYDALSSALLEYHARTRIVVTETGWPTSPVTESYLTGLFDYVERGRSRAEMIYLHRLVDNFVLPAADMQWGLLYVDGEDSLAARFDIFGGRGWSFDWPSHWWLVGATCVAVVGSCRRCCRRGVLVCCSTVLVFAAGLLGSLSVYILRFL